jgi:magnesium transporter
MPIPSEVSTVAVACPSETLTFGSTMPLAAQALKIDPAVISVPLVTTLVDTSGLIIYFLVAGAILGL